MGDRFENKGFTQLTEASDFHDLTVYERRSVALIAMLRLKADKQAARQAGNSLDDRLMQELKMALDILDSRAHISSIIITSQHNLIFSIGAKIEMVLGAGFEQALRFTENAQTLITRLRSCKKTLVAAINGWAFGGGLEIAMACDHRIAGDGNHVLIGLPESSLGLIPGMGGTYFLSRLVGVERAGEYILSARADFDPFTAQKDGLIDDVVPQAALIDEAFALANRASHETPREAAQPQAAVDRQKVRSEIGDWLQASTGPRDTDKTSKAAPLARAMIHFVLEKTRSKGLFETLIFEQEAFAYLATTADSQEGIRAMLEEREPDFQGR